MASVGEVKAVIDAANATANEAVAAARVAVDKLNEAQQQLAAALEGGHHDSINTAIRALQHASQQFEEGIQAVAGSAEASQQYGAGL
jgi:ABC-type transporter Mla subunit MlaD